MEKVLEPSLRARLRALRFLFATSTLPAVLSVTVPAQGSMLVDGQVRDSLAVPFFTLSVRLMVTSIAGSASTCTLPVTWRA